MFIFLIKITLFFRFIFSSRTPTQVLQQGHSLQRESAAADVPATLGRRRTHQLPGPAPGRAAAQSVLHSPVG